VPDLDLRMGLYRRLGDLEDREAIDAFAAELIDRFGALPNETANLMKIVEVKLNCRAGSIAKLDIGPKGALVTFAPNGFPDLPALLGYMDRLKGAAKLRPDSRMSVSRDWPNPEARLNGALQLSRGLARVATASETSKSELEPA
jgi:transcription-repair coupling factor (superfamily II helicase)